MDSGAHLRCPALVRVRAPPDADHLPGHLVRLKALKKFALIVKSVATWDAPATR